MITKEHITPGQVTETRTYLSNLRVECQRANNWNAIQPLLQELTKSLDPFFALATEE